MNDGPPPWQPVETRGEDSRKYFQHLHPAVLNKHSALQVSAGSDKIESDAYFFALRNKLVSSSPHLFLPADLQIKKCLLYLCTTKTKNGPFV
jgi:hypothetical protein